MFAMPPRGSARSSDAWPSTEIDPWTISPSSRARNGDCTSSKPQSDSDLIAQIIEKDFWVCWTLKRLFVLDGFRDHLTFKGGTTLSKVYRIIERFSEDIDIAIERDFLGFGGPNNPEEGTTGKEQQRRIDRLKLACQTVIADQLMPQLDAAITEALGTVTPTGFFLWIAPTLIGRRVLFTYPASIRWGS